MSLELDRYWLLTWTTYGTWLPGDRRGFVSEHRDADGDKILHNRPTEPYDADDAALRRYAEFRMASDAFRLEVEQADALVEQFRETADFRGWSLFAAAVMSNHVHVVVGVPGDPEPELLLRDFKSYGSRRLNRRFGKPTSGTWWTESGSRRKLPNEQAVASAITYVEQQRSPLATWSITEASGGCQPPGDALLEVRRAKRVEPVTGRLTPAARPVERSGGANPTGSHRPLAGDDWKPAICLERLRKRALAMDAVREFFRSRGYLEVDTPILSHDVVVDAHLDPFTTRFRPEPGVERDELFLQTSPEFHVKRLLCALAEDQDPPAGLWQVSRVMRQGELGRWHQPEFTMVEWYGLGDTYVEQMAFTEELVAAVLEAVSEKEQIDRPFDRLAYDEAFERHVGSRVLELHVAALAALAERHDVTPPAGLEDRDGWLNLLLTTLVEPKLVRPTFVFDYPDSQAALAKVRDDRPPVAERFELYWEGIELANGYDELRDVEELRRRNAEQNAVRRREGLPPLPGESRLLAAMEAGLPACSGVALGFDRLFAVAVGARSLAEVVPFPFERA